MSDNESDSLFVQQDDDIYEQHSLIDAVNYDEDDTSETYDGNNLKVNGNEILIESNEESTSLTLRDDIYHSEEIFKSVTLSAALSFQKTIIRDLLAEDALLVLGRGLGLHLIAANLLHALDVAGTAPPPTATSNLPFTGVGISENGGGCNRVSLVLLIGATDKDNQRISEELWQLAQLSEDPYHCHRGLTIVSTDSMSLKRRETLYQNGGVFSITSRILIADMLVNIIDCTKVTGIVALSAHRVSEVDYLGWILRIYRRKNSKGFIKALSEDPEGFNSSGGLSPLATKLKILHLRRVLLWPRFHLEVTDSLLGSTAANNNINSNGKSLTGTGKKRNEVIEIRVELSDSMRHMQTAIMESIESCISAIKRSVMYVKDLNSEDWSLDNALSQDIARRVRIQLQPFWHRISGKAKLLVADLFILQDLLVEMLVIDSVGFFQRLDEIVVSNNSQVGSLREQSQWLLEDAGSALITLSRDRVFGPKDNSNNTHHIEQLPKWYQLISILEEVTADKAVGNPEDTGGPVLIMCNEPRIANQLRAYISSIKRDDDPLNSPGQWFMRTKLSKYRERKKFESMFSNSSRRQQQSNTADTNAPVTGETATPPTGTSSSSGPNSHGRSNKRRRLRGGSVIQNSLSRSETTLANLSIPDSQEIPGTDEITNTDNEISVIGVNDDNQLDNDILDAVVVENIFDDDSQSRSFFSPFELFSNDSLIVIENYDPHKNETILEELMPSYVIMYEPDPAFFRRIEVTRATHLDRQIKVYFMFYTKSVEEQKYLSQVRREKDAFTRLIREKAAMPIHLETERDKAISTAVGGNGNTVLRNVNTRIAGGALLQTEKPIIVVDIRELRSALPSILDLKNFQVVPMSLEVGDYILSPEICVERKSIPDLISSFQSGHLDKQCTAMCRSYELPTLLIEFSDANAFSFDSLRDAPGISSNNSVGGPPRNVAGGLNSYEPSMMKDDTVQSKITLLLLHHPKLKVIWSSGPYQTTEIFADLKNKRDQPDPNICANIGLENNEQPHNYNFTAVDMLLTMPGINSKNYQLIMRKVPNIQTLCSMPESAIAKIIGKEAASKLVQFFNNTL